MEDWMTRLNLLPEHKLVRDGKLGIREYAGIVAQRLRSMNWPELYADERDDIAGEFEDVAADKTADANDFYEVLERLYDLADTRVDNSTWPHRRLCWVKTF